MRLSEPAAAVLAAGWRCTTQPPLTANYRAWTAKLHLRSLQLQVGCSALELLHQLLGKGQACREVRQGGQRGSRRCINGLGQCDCSCQTELG